MTCYPPGRSNILFFGLNPKGAKFDFFSGKWPPYFWKPLTCGYVAAGAFFLRKMALIFLQAPNLWVRCRRRLFSPEKWPPDFCKPPTCGYVAAGAFSSPEKCHKGGGGLWVKHFSKAMGPKAGQNLGRGCAYFFLFSCLGLLYTFLGY